MLFLARLICSDPGCAELSDVTAATMDELDALICDCGCSLDVLAVSLDAGTGADVVVLRPRAEPEPLAA